MVGVSLRQKPLSATEQNALISLRPVSGTPVWARNDLAPGTPRPASPWDRWTIPPKPAALTDTRRPSPRPTEPADLTKTSATTAVSVATEPSPPFRPWRVDFARPDVIEYPERPGHPVVESPDSATVAKRLLLLLGLAYLFLAALASGLAYTGFFAADNADNADRDQDGGEDTGEEPVEGPLPPRPPTPRPPSRDADAPGLHTRPDGTRYLVMPLPSDIADRFRDRANAVRTAPAMAPAASAMTPAMASALGGAVL